MLWRSTSKEMTIVSQQGMCALVLRLAQAFSGPGQDAPHPPQMCLLVEEDGTNGLVCSEPLTASHRNVWADQDGRRSSPLRFAWWVARNYHLCHHSDCICPSIFEKPQLPCWTAHGLRQDRSKPQAQPRIPFSIAHLLRNDCSKPHGVSPHGSLS